MKANGGLCAFFALTLSFCLAQDFLDDTLEAIEILGASGPPGWDSNWVLTNGYTLRGQTPSLTAKCYSSREPKVEVFINIPTAEVSVVNILNRVDTGSPRMANLQVFVCQSGGTCAHCADAPDTAAGAWARLQCANGPLTGNQIKLHNPSVTVDFCEVYVLGKNLNANKPSILGGVGPMPWSADWVLTNGYSKAGQAQTPNTCCCTAYCLDAYALLDITPASISQVRLLNRPDAAESRLTGTKVELCSKDGLCQLCGEAPATGKGQWATITCANGPLKGNLLKLTQKNDCLQFCEVDLIGETLPTCGDNCQDYHRFCGALKSRSFVEDYKTMMEAGSLGGFGKKQSLPPSPSCDDDFYKTACPKSCLECTAC